MMDIQVCYLFLIPYQKSSNLGPALTIPAPKDAPYFFELDIEFRTSWGERQIEVLETAVTVQLQVLDSLVFVAECRYLLRDALSQEGAHRQMQIQAALQARLTEEIGAESETAESFTILLVRELEETPDAFVDQQAGALIQLLRSLPKPVTDLSRETILNSRARYSAAELTVIDWSGAIIVSAAGDFRSDIELLKIGKYQLLRYRLMDQRLQEMLRRVRDHLPRARRLRWLPAPYTTLQTIVEQRLSLLLDFEKIDQSLLLIGDWYSAQVYEQIVYRFSLEEWKGLVSSKLDNLAAIDAVVRENLTFSWRRLIDFVVFVGWVFLLIGYLFLFFADLG